MSIRFVDPPTTCTICTPSVKIFLIIVKLSREECCAHFYTYIYVRTVYIMYYSFPSFCFLSYPFFFFSRKQCNEEYDTRILRQGTGCFRKNFIDSWQIYKIEVARCETRVIFILNVFEFLSVFRKWSNLEKWDTDSLRRTTSLKLPKHRIWRILNIFIYNI